MLTTVSLLHRHPARAAWHVSSHARCEPCARKGRRPYMCMDTAGCTCTVVATNITGCGGPAACIVSGSRHGSHSNKPAPSSHRVVLHTTITCMGHGRVTLATLATASSRDRMKANLVCSVANEKRLGHEGAWRQHWAQLLLHIGRLLPRQHLSSLPWQRIMRGMTYPNCCCGFDAMLHVYILLLQRIQHQHRAQHHHREKQRAAANETTKP